MTEAKMERNGAGLYTVYIKENGRVVHEVQNVTQEAGARLIDIYRSERSEDERPDM